MSPLLSISEIKKNSSYRNNRFPEFADSFPFLCNHIGCCHMIQTDNITRF